MSFRNDDTSGDAERPSGIPTVNPWAARPAEPSAPPQPPLPEPPRSKWFNWPSVAFAVVIFGGIGAQAYQELSKPEAWAYWKDLYISPSMASSEVGSLDPDNSGRGRPALAITGEIGPATASWFREKLDEAKLAPGDTVLLSSPGGNVGQAIIMGEIIRARGLTTAVGTVDWHSSEKMAAIPAYEFGIVVNHNPDNVPRMGSCIFIHLWLPASRGTAGCTALHREDLLALLGWLDPERQPVLIQWPAGVAENPPGN